MYAETYESYVSCRQGCLQVGIRQKWLDMVLPYSKLENGTICRPSSSPPLYTLAFLVLQSTGLMQSESAVCDPVRGSKGS